jgi:hypothetical protein
MCELIAIAQNKFKESKMINKKRTPVFDKKKLPTATKTPQENAQTNNSITKIEQSEKTKDALPKDFIPEIESIESTASKDTKDTVGIPAIAAEPVKSLSPKDLVPKLGINDKMIRIFLRKNYPRPEKGKQWEITPEFAKRIIKDYTAKSKSDKAEKTEQIQEQLTAK